MRHLFAVPMLAILAGATALPAAAQMADRYGGVNHYAPPVAQQQPQRVLSWPGKTIPAPSPPQAAYPQAPGHPAYGSALQPPPYAQGRGAPPAPYAQERNAGLYPPTAYPAPLAYQPYPPTPYSAPYPAQPGAMPPPYPPQGGAPTAMAPSGVYPAQPGYPQPGFPMQGLPPSAYPPAPFPQGPVPQPNFPAPQGPPQPMGAPVQPPPPPPPPPPSIYAPPPQAEAGDPSRPRMVAANTATPAAAGARVYSLHRDFGLQPDPAVASFRGGESVELTAALDGGAQQGAEGLPREAVGLRTLADMLGDD